MNARWTPETEILLAREVYAFADNGRGLPGYDEDDPDVRDACLEGARQFLAALADAGLLVPPSPTPRVWAMPTIPDDVKAVRDRDGFVWQRGVDDATPHVWRRSTGARSEGGLNWIALTGPLTEVDE